MTRKVRKPARPASGNLRRASARRSTATDADAAVRHALIESHRDLLKFLRRRLGNRDEAEEVLQAFVVRALERVSDLRDVTAARGWLSRVLATAIADHQRRSIRKRHRETTLDEFSGALETESETEQAVCNCLYKLLPTLKPEYADVIWRADLLGEPRDRIAVSLGTSASNLAVRLYRARRALKLRLEQMCLTCPVHGFLDCRCARAEHLQKIRAGGRDQAAKGTRAPTVTALRARPGRSVDRGAAHRSMPRSLKPNPR